MLCFTDRTIQYKDLKVVSNLDYTIHIMVQLISANLYCHILWWVPVRDAPTSLSCQQLRQLPVVVLHLFCHQDLYPWHRTLAPSLRTYYAMSLSICPSTANWLAHYNSHRTCRCTVVISVSGAYFYGTTAVLIAAPTAVITRYELSSFAQHTLQHGTPWFGSKTDHPITSGIHSYHITRSCSQMLQE